MAKSHFAHTALEIRDVDLVDSGVLRQVDLSPALQLAELPDSLSELEAHIRRHALSIDLVEALYLADALSGRDQLQEALPRLASGIRHCNAPLWASLLAE